MFLLSALLALAPVAAVAHDTRVIPLAVQGAGRERVKDRWWESTAAMVRISPRGKTPFPFLEQARVEAALDDLLAQGIGAVEVFAPAEGGRSFGGLDTINRYRFEPVAGTLDDFKRMVRLAHARGMAVISFDNLGYSSVEAVEFLKAADDVRDGRKSPEASFFVWSDSKTRRRRRSTRTGCSSCGPPICRAMAPAASTNRRNTSIGSGASAPAGSTGPSGEGRTARDGR
jgi:hypothetical protein